MATVVNKVFLLGNACKDPVVRATPGGMIVANFATRYSRPDNSQDGLWTDTTEWHNLVGFQRTAKLVRDHVKKGSHLFIKGKIQTRSGDDKQSGEKRYKSEILVPEMSRLGSSQDAERAARIERNSLAPILGRRHPQRKMTTAISGSPTRTSRSGGRTKESGPLRRASSF